MPKFKFTPPQKYYLVYDKKTGIITSLTNQKDPAEKYAYEISAEEYVSFLEKEKYTRDYVIGYTKGVTGKTELSLIQVSNQLYGFRNNIFQWIKNPPTKTTELTVEWNLENQTWIFTLSQKAKTRLADSITSNAVFFIMLKNDFDFLIRTMLVNVKELMEEPEVRIPFTSKIETQIDKISISSRIYFQSYGLIKNG